MIAHLPSLCDATLSSVYWIHGTTAKLTSVLQPGARELHTTMLAHEWWVRDARTDTRPDSPGRHRLTDNTSLQKWKITSDSRRYYTVPLRRCYDLSGHCSFWVHQGECRKNPTFMREQCSLTCSFCERDIVNDDGDHLDEDVKNDDSMNKENGDAQNEGKASPNDEL